MLITPITPILETEKVWGKEMRRKKGERLLTSGSAITTGHGALPGFPAQREGARTGVQVMDVRGSRDTRVELGTSWIRMKLWRGLLCLPLIPVYPCVSVAGAPASPEEAMENGDHLLFSLSRLTFL